MRGPEFRFGFDFEATEDSAGAVVATGGALLLDDGGYLLLEDGGKLVLE